MSPELPTRAQAVDRAAARLRAGGIGLARLEARRLLQAALGLPPEGLLDEPGRALLPADAAVLDASVARRLAGEPLSRILGHREFWSLDFLLSPETLDPRPDSETLVAAALELLPAERPARILDLGTGSGCLLLAILSERPLAFGVGVDRSEGACRTARENARRLGLAGRAAFAVGDWAECLAGPFDLVVSNPPYIAQGEIAGLAPEVRAHDPVAALDGGADGLDAYRAILPALARLLAPGGTVLVEVGLGQADPVTNMMAVENIRVDGRPRDLAGIERCVVGTKKTVFSPPSTD